MSLSLSDIRYAAELACIAITDEEADDALVSLNRTMALIDRMRAIPVSDVEPMSHVQPMPLRFRADVVTEHDERDALQRAAPSVEDGLFLVPKVIE